MSAPRILAFLIAGTLGSGVLAATDAVQAASAQAMAAKPLPNVLIIGDSISLGYMATVVQALKGKAVVVRNRDPNNSGSTGRGIANNMHFSKEGYRKIGQQVAAAIEKALAERVMSRPESLATVRTAHTTAEDLDHA